MKPYMCLKINPQTEMWGVYTQKIEPNSWDESCAVQDILCEELIATL